MTATRHTRAPHASSDPDTGVPTWDRTKQFLLTLDPAPRAHQRGLEALTYTTQTLRTVVSTYGGRAVAALQRERQMDAHTVSQRSPLRGDRGLAGTACPHSSGIKRVGNQLGSEVFVELPQGQSRGRPACARAQHPGVDDAHTQQRQVHSHRPIVSHQLVLQLQVGLPISVVPIKLSAARVGVLSDLGLVDGHRHPLRAVLPLPPSDALIQLAGKRRGGGRDEESAIAVDLHDGHQVHHPFCRRVEVRRMFPPGGHLQGRQGLHWVATCRGLDYANKPQTYRPQLGGSRHTCEVGVSANDALRPRSGGDEALENVGAMRQGVIVRVVHCPLVLGRRHHTQPQHDAAPPADRIMHLAAAFWLAI